MHTAFESYVMTTAGMEQAAKIRDEFSGLLHFLEEKLPKSRELSIVATKLEEAAFFAQKANAKAHQPAAE